jgi:hypothetical protein
MTSLTPPLLLVIYKKSVLVEKGLVEKSVFVPSDSVMTVTKFDHCYSIVMYIYVSPCATTTLAL